MKKAVWSMFLLTTVACMILGCDNNKKGEEKMEFTFMTKEEFITYIDTNDTDVTLEDFDGIDIDDFISQSYFSKENISHYSLAVALDDYLRRMERQRRAAYMAQEIVSVDSSDVEYEKFRDQLILSIGGGVESAGKHNTLDVYQVSYTDSGGKKTWDYIYIGQTKHLKKYSTIRDNAGYYIIQLPMDSEGLYFTSGFCYSKNKKYFLIAAAGNDFFFELIKAFCEIDD